MPRISETKNNTNLYSRNVSSGLVETLPSFVDNFDGTYTVGDCDVILYDNNRQEGSPKLYTIPGGLRDISDTPNEVRYLIAEYNGGSPILVDWLFSQLPDWDSSSFAPIYTMFNENNVLIHHMSWDGLGQGLSDKNHRRILKTQRFARESGGDLSVLDPTHSIRSDSGVFWVGSIEHELPGFDSAAAVDGVSTITINPVGSGYTDGLYVGVTGTGVGTDLTLDVTVSQGIVTKVDIQHGGHGSGWTASDVITISDATIGNGTGALFAVDVTGHRFYFYHNTGTGLTIDIVETVVDGILTTAEISINTGGTGYYQGDILPITSGGNGDATISLDTVSAGVVTAISIVSGGTGYTDTVGATTYEGWTAEVITDATGTYNITSYDGGDGTLDGGGSAGVNDVTDTHYVVNWVYRDVEVPPHLSIVLAEHTFSTLAEAQGATTRNDLPPAFSVIGFLIGRVIIQKNGSTADVIESAFTEFQPSLVTSHSALAGLQGGLIDEYFHLNSAEQQHLTDGLPLCLTTYVESPTKDAVQNIHGSLLAIADQSGTVLNSGTPITGNNGQSKMMFHVGVVTTPGTLRIVGTTVDRNTGIALDDGVATVTIDTAGSGYTNGTYTGVTGTGAGTDITVDVTVAGGVVTAVIVQEGGVGSGWTVSDVITINDADIGNGTSATFSVATVGDIEDIVITTVSTDASTTDANGIDEWSFTNAYITSKWFNDGFTITTTDVSLTGVDIYQSTYEQFNDKPYIIIDSIDANFFVTNTGASFSGHFYTVKVSAGNRVDITEIASNIATTATATAFPVATRFYRARDGNLNTPINGTTDGIFVSVTMLGLGAYFNDFGLKIWVRVLPGIAP